MKICYNPYIVGEHVEGKHFYGRSQLLDEIQTQPCKVIHLLGMRRIGKTSLLKRIEHIQENALYINLQSVGGDWHTFAREFLRVIRRGRRIWTWLPEESFFTDKNVCEMLYILDEYAQDKNTWLWLLFDEIEALIALARSDISAFQKFQAAIWETLSIRMIFASAKRLTELDNITASVEYGTPFLNHFPPPTYISHLSTDEAVHLICQTQENLSIRVPEATIEDICNWTNNHPFYIQWMCHLLWKNNRNPTSWRIDKVHSEIIPHLDRMLRYDFDYLSLPEQKIIESVLRNKPLPNINRAYVSGLLKLGYLKRNGDGYAIGNNVLRLWLEALPEQDWFSQSTVSADSTLRLYEKVTIESSHINHLSRTEQTNEEDTFGQKYGTDRDLTIDDVRRIVAQCLAFMQRGGKVPEFYRRQSDKHKYTLETLRSWLRDKRFRPKDRKT